MAEPELCWLFRSLVGLSSDHFQSAESKKHHRGPCLTTALVFPSYEPLSLHYIWRMLQLHGLDGAFILKGGVIHSVKVLILMNVDKLDRRTSGQTASQNNQKTRRICSPHFCALKTLFFFFAYSVLKTPQCLNLSRQKRQSFQLNSDISQVFFNFSYCFTSIKTKKTLYSIR